MKFQKIQYEAMDFILCYVGNKFTKDEKWSGKINISLSNKAYSR